MMEDVYIFIFVTNNVRIRMTVISRQGYKGREGGRGSTIILINENPLQKIQLFQ